MTPASNPPQPGAVPQPKSQTVAEITDLRPSDAPVAIKRQSDLVAKFEAYLDGHARQTHEKREENRLLFDTPLWLRDESVYAFRG